MFHFQAYLGAQSIMGLLPYIKTTERRIFHVFNLNLFNLYAVLLIWHTIYICQKLVKKVMKSRKKKFFKFNLNFKV